MEGREGGREGGERLKREGMIIAGGMERGRNDGRREAEMEWRQGGGERGGVEEEEEEGEEREGGRKGG